jgi:hypothetical protein
MDELEKQVKSLKELRDLREHMAEKFDKELLIIDMLINRHKDIVHKLTTPPL